MQLYKTWTNQVNFFRVIVDCEPGNAVADGTKTNETKRNETKRTKRTKRKAIVDCEPAFTQRGLQRLYRKIIVSATTYLFAEPVTLSK